MSMPYPPHTALASDTDLAIRALAYAADGQIGSATKYFVSTGTSPTDVNGEIVVDLHTSATLTGVLVCQRGFEVAYGQVKDQAPIPPASNRPAIPPNAYYFIPRQFLSGGLVWVRVMTSVYRGSAGTDNTWFGSQPITSGLTLKWAAIGWAPA